MHSKQSRAAVQTETRSYGPAAHAVALHPLRCGHELQRHGLQFCLEQVDRTQCLLRPDVDLHEGLTRVTVASCQWLASYWCDQVAHSVIALRVEQFGWP